MTRRSSSLAVLGCAAALTLPTLATAAPTDIALHIQEGSTFDTYTNASTWAAATKKSGETVELVRFVQFVNPVTSAIDPAVLLGISNGFGKFQLVLTESSCTGAVLSNACYQGYSIQTMASIKSFSASSTNITLEYHLYHPNTSGGLSKVGYADLDVAYDSSTGLTDTTVDWHNPAGTLLDTINIESSVDDYFLTGVAPEYKYAIGGATVQASSIYIDKTFFPIPPATVITREMVLGEVFSSGPLIGSAMAGYAVPGDYSFVDRGSSLSSADQAFFQRQLDFLKNPWCFPIRDPATGEWVDPITGDPINPIGWGVYDDE